MPNGCGGRWGKIFARFEAQFGYLEFATSLLRFLLFRRSRRRTRPDLGRRARAGAARGGACAAPWPAKASSRAAAERPRKYWRGPQRLRPPRPARGLQPTIWRFARSARPADWDAAGRYSDAPSGPRRFRGSGAGGGNARRSSIGSTRTFRSPERVTQAGRTLQIRRRAMPTGHPFGHIRYHRDQGDRAQNFTARSQAKSANQSKSEFRRQYEP